jgi:hypothetical protein
MAVNPIINASGIEVLKMTILCTSHNLFATIWNRLLGISHCCNSCDVNVTVVTNMYLFYEFSVSNID